jgi:hypothetical protein
LAGIVAGARTALAGLAPARSADIPDAAFAFLDPLRGKSGAVQAVFRSPGASLAPAKPPAGATVLYEEGDEAAEAPASGKTPVKPGVYTITLKTGDARRKAEDLRLITLVPFSEKREGRVGRYELGFWPSERDKEPRAGAYALPAGFVEVTRDNRSTRVSNHFKLADFLTKDQHDVWPKYLVLDSRLLDKLELIIQELEAAGRDIDRVHVMSGFRTPLYNAQGGDPRGRGSLSRHIYGDAADVWVDDDDDGLMDDLNKDRRIDMADSEFIASAAERVEAGHPSLAGGIAPYPACCGHGPFTHVDTRGRRARWRGQ